MAKLKSTHPDVKAAEQEVFKYTAEAQCLAELLEKDDSSVSILAISAIERLTNAFEQLHGALLRHGIEPLEKRLNLS